MNSPLPQIQLPPNPLELQDSERLNQWARGLPEWMPRFPDLRDSVRLKFWIRDLQIALSEFIQRATLQINSQVQGVGLDLASSAELKPTHPIHRVTGTTTVTTITVQLGFTGPLFLIPKGVWAWNTSGNIALSGTAVVDKLLVLVFDGQEWFPSYT